MSVIISPHIERAARKFPVFAPLLKIRTITGDIAPLHLNSIQQQMDKSITDQLQRTGMVRKVVLKARRQGLSTYAMSRMYWHTLFRRGIGAYCLTHHQETTDELFSMVGRFKMNLPSELQYSTDADSAKGFTFTKTQSSMKVGTAGGKLVGHGFTITHFMGSEVSRWPNATEHFGGIMQAVSRVHGTEIVLESVGGSRGGLWHNLCIESIKGKSGFEFMFFPWFAMDDYTMQDTGEWERSREDLEYQKEYKLTDGQMAWRCMKLKDFPVDPHLNFAAMYPSTVDDAFMRMEGGFIQQKYVTAARKEGYTPLGPVIFGVDIGGGKDRTALVRRQGKAAYHIETLQDGDPMQVVAWIGRRLEKDKPDACFIDASGASVGNAVCSRLQELGFKNVYGVQFGGKSEESDKYINKRVEMWDSMRQWLIGGAEIPDNEALESDLLAPSRLDEDAQGRMRLESKIDMRRKGIPSPDIADALALTFAYPVADNSKASEIYTPHDLMRSQRKRTTFGRKL